MAKAMRIAKGPSKHIIKRPATKAAVPPKTRKQQPTGGNDSALWSPIKMSSSFVSQVELEQKRELLREDIKMKEMELRSLQMQLQVVEKELKTREVKLLEAAGEPTGKLLNVSIGHSSANLAVSCQFLSGNLACTVRLPLDATVGDLQSYVHEKMQWAASGCIDNQSSAMPGHSALQGCTDLILKELELDEVIHLSQPQLNIRKFEATAFLKKMKLPLRYEQQEHWEDGQGVGGDADIKLEFRVSSSDDILKFGKLIDLQNNVGRRRCDELIRSAKYQCAYKAPYGYFDEECGEKGRLINKARGPSRIEVINSELRLKKILTDLAEEANAFSGADWDSVTDCWHGDSSSAAAEVQRRRQETRNIIRATLAWIEKSCTSDMLSAVYVRLEHGERTFFDRDSRESDSEGSWNGSRFDRDSETPGRSIVEGTGILFLKAQSGATARLSLEKRTDDFAGCY